VLAALVAAHKHASLCRVWWLLLLLLLLLLLRLHLLSHALHQHAGVLQHEVAEHTVR
jgi:hypothetical protein